MLDRPALSISIGRRPSFRTSGDRSVPPSPLSSHPPITPQNTSFFSPSDSYFPAGAAPSTPPILTNGGAGVGLFPPAFPGRRGLLRRNSSLSSVSSSVADDDDDDTPEWTQDEEEKVRTIYDACLAQHSLTEAPFPLTGPPPSNFTNTVARAVLRLNGPGRVTRASTRARTRARKPVFLAGSGSSDVDSDNGAGSEVEMDAPAPRWRHGLRATRLKILALAKERQNAALAETPRQSDPDATPMRRKPLARQGSMDFLPTVHHTANIARLGSMLRQPSSEGFPSTAPSSSTPSHPYAHSGHSRLQRTNSLESIAGSPSQPESSRKSTAASTLKKAPASSQRMMRFASGSNVLPSTTAPPLSRALSFAGRPGRRRAAPSEPVALATPAAIPAAPLPSSVTPKKESAPIFSLGPDFALLTTPLNASSKRPPTSGLGSAFNSPVVGAYPTPESLQKGGRAKKGKVAKKAKLDDGAHDLKMEQQPLRAGFVNEPKAFALPTKAAFEGDVVDAKNRPALGVSSSFGFLESSAISSPRRGSDGIAAPSSSFSSVLIRPPKLILTPSLSPSSSFDSLPAEEPGTPSPLSAAFDLNDLKLESLSPADIAAGESEDECMPVGSGDDEQHQDQQKSGLGFGFLDAEYVQAGNEAKALRDQLSTWDWNRQC
ncbi:hypothetical protein JCM1841_000982 [Sporobolomyces salmonicolor]